MLDDPADFMPFACEVLRTVAPLPRDTESLVSALRDKRLLVVMDNCEHVIPQAAELARLLAVSAPKVRVIATSREPLRVKGGTTHRLGSLPLEDAVELFTERARAGGIWLGDERRAIIAAIVQQLDSIPLAIELAAPQLRSMSPEELLRRLDERLQVLGASNRGGASRQQTLEALLGWSHRLLDENGRKRFRRLAVFTGGCTLEAAMHVCGDEEQLNEAVVGEALADLVSKSLVSEESSPSGPRYRMLEITRIYAQGLLVASDEFDAAAYAHVRFFTTLALRFEGTLEATPVTHWRSLVSMDGRNFPAAPLAGHRRGRRRQRRDDLSGAPLLAVGARGRTGNRSGAAHCGDSSDDAAPIRRGADALGAGLARSPLGPDARARGGAALAGSVSRARRRHPRRRALGCTVATELETVSEPDPSLEGEMLRFIETMLDLGSTLRAAELLNNLGVFYAQLLDDSRLPEALVCFERAAALLEARGDADRCGRVIGNSAGIAFLLGDAELAARRSPRGRAL